MKKRQSLHFTNCLTHKGCNHAWRGTEAIFMAQDNIPIQKTFTLLMSRHDCNKSTEAHSNEYMVLYGLHMKASTEPGSTDIRTR
jgi:hypothetical protein